jgi:arylsulfatase A-like enzyme
MRSHFFVPGALGAVRKAAGLVVLAAALLLAPHDASRFAGEHSLADLRTRMQDANLNLLLVTLDTTRADRICAYGDTRAAETPALDRLAGEGVLFEDASSPVPLTVPAHSTLFTGRLPPSHGVHENVGLLDDATPTLATVLEKRGYRTAAFVGSQVLARSHGLNRGFEVYDDEIPWVQGSGPSRSRRRADAVVDRALAWIGAAKEGRFFAWLHFYDAHAPYEPTAPFNTAYAGRSYEAAIASVDAQIGRVRAYLDRNRLTERTVIVVIGDHGEGLGDHGELTHGLFVYQSVLRVPFIIRAPFGALQGRRVATAVSGADVMPTVLDLLGAGAVEGIEGRSLVPVIVAPRRAMAADVYAENLYIRRRFGWSEMRSIRAGAFKFIDKTKPELYDLQRDPGEAHDLSAEQPALAARLAARLRAWQEQPGDRGTTNGAPDAEVPAAVRNGLSALGYVAGATAADVVTGGPALSDPRDHVELFNRLTVPPSRPPAHDEATAWLLLRVGDR